VSSNGTAELVKLDDGFSLSGPLTFESAAGLWPMAQTLFRGGSQIRLDLDGVTRTDSAGVALLVGWLREARRRGATLRLENLPAQMIAIAEVGNVDRLLAGG
jgi:phospholipid transport system transporter-binding protein